MKVQKAMGRGCSFLLALASSGIVRAEKPVLDDPAFGRAAAVVLLFDNYSARCGNPDPKDAAAAADWERANGVALIRNHLRELEAAPDTSQMVKSMRGFTEKAIAANPVPACAAIVSVTRNREAQFKNTASAVLEALRGGSGAAPAATASPAPQPGTSQPVRASPVAASGGSNPALSEIEAFGFGSGTTMGVGGFLTVRIYPVVLFRGGDALTEVQGLASPGGIAGHRRDHPKDWTRWRRIGGEIQLRKGAEWVKLPFRTTHPRLPDGFRLDGFFRSTTGTGTVAIGGSQQATAWSEYRFWNDGRVVRGGGAGASSADSSIEVVTASVAPNRRGRYRVEGLELLVTWDDGSSERRILITDPADPKASIWLDGVGYARRTPPR
jgi:hypothetical protein